MTRSGYIVSYCFWSILSYKYGSSIFNFSDTIIWDGMFLDEELQGKKGWGHSSIEQGVNLANEIEFKKFLISHQVQQD